MSGKKKAKRAERKAQTEADVTMNRANWENMGQWQYEAETSRDKNVRGINQKYGAENQKLRDILVGEEERKYEATQKDLRTGATGQQLTQFYGQYGAQTGQSQEEYLTGFFGEYKPTEPEGPAAGEEAAAAGAAGRVPIQPGDGEDGEAYFGW